MAPAVTREDLGAWLLKCNPASWDLRAFLASGERRLTSWAVQRNYRSGLMEPGDRVLFWVSGDGRHGLRRGLWGGGELTARAEPWIDAERGLWSDEGARASVRGRVELDITVWEAPVDVFELRSRGLGDLEVLRMPFGSNPSWVTRAQLAAVDELVAA